MPFKKIKQKKNKPNPVSPYLTKRRLVKAATVGIQEAARKTMQTMGYTVVVKDGWVIKQFADGAVEKIEHINKQKTAV